MRAQGLDPARDIGENRTVSNRTLRGGILGGLAFVFACGARTALPVPDRVDDPGTSPASCEDADVTYIYVVTSENELLRFDPRPESSSAPFSTIGTLDCPGSNGATPFSMAVDRKGTAYVVFQNGELFEVSTRTAACKATSFSPRQRGFSTFGMGFSADDTGLGETLFVAESNFRLGSSAGLGSIDTGSLELAFVARFTPNLGNLVELTGTGDGRLYGIFIDTGASNSTIGRIDKRNASVSEFVKVPLGASTHSLAFSFWGGDFYVFHAESGPTNVTRFHPEDGSFVDVAKLPTHVVGVGVSTCAPR
jgi:hypothetical protein